LGGDIAAGAFELLGQEALHLGHNYVGTEHLLLGLFRDEDSIATTALVSLGASSAVVRDRTLEFLAGFNKG
jgi:ATP-dependent Clp protease ATP-binding subunit ClpC